jgi:hypothetical protein
MAYGLLIHSPDYAGLIDEHFDDDISRMNTYAIRVELDYTSDDRPTWLFKGLTVGRTNKLLKSISSRSLQPFVHDMDENMIRHLCTPYDAMSFTTDIGERLSVAYCIAPLTSRLRTCILGPTGISLYEKYIPHFGPIYVYRSEQSDGACHKFLPIESSVDEILNVLSTLNFGA